MRARLLLAVPLLLFGLPVRQPQSSPAAPVATIAPSSPGPVTDERAELERAVHAVAWWEQATAKPAPRSSLRVSRSGGSHRGYASAKECVAMTEHGGSYDRSSNPSHFGRYQFSRSTWTAYGGNPATWGSASAGEQDAVFETAWNSPGGPDNWLPYDNC